MDDRIQFAVLRMTSAIAAAIFLSIFIFASDSPADEYRRINAVTYSPNGHLIAVDVETLLYVWNTESWELQVGVNYSPNSMWSTLDLQTEFSPDGNRIAVTSYDFGTIIMNSRTAADLVTLVPNSTDIAFSPDGNLALAFDNNPIRRDNTLYLHDTSDGRRVGNFQISIIKQIQQLRSTAFSKDGTMVAAGGSYWPEAGGVAAFVAVWDTDTRAGRFIWTSTSVGVAEISFTPDSALLMILGLGGTVSIVETEDGMESAQLQSRCGRIADISFLSGRNSAAALCENGAVQVCELKSGSCALAPAPQVDGALALAAHPDGRHVALATRFSSVMVVNIDTGEKIRKLTIPRKAKDLILEGGPRSILDMVKEAAD